LKQGLNGSAQLQEEMKNHLVSRLASYKCPQILEFVNELPKTATGKIQRFKLRSDNYGNAPNGESEEKKRLVLAPKLTSRDS
jgi:acyl-coenzyme A synthetase/AMP-(fatty) acid ligase